MRVRRLYQCGNCAGEGILDDYAFSKHPTVCPDCDGSGQILVHPDFSMGLIPLEAPNRPEAQGPSKPKGP